MSRSVIVILHTVAALAVAGVVAHAQTQAVASSPAVAPTAVVVASHPSWVDDTLEPDGRASIASVVSGSPDIVVLDHGLYVGFRVGTPCLVERNGTTVGELVVVASQPSRAAALITSQSASTALQAGDQVRLKTLSHVL
jgi:hypothetical protein